MSGNDQTAPDERAQRVESVAAAIEKTAQKLSRRIGTSLLDDLRSAGTLAAITAADRFDPQAGATFEGYAWPRIAGAMVDLLRKERRRLPAHVAKKLDAAIVPMEAAIAYGAELRHVEAEDLRGRAAGAAMSAGAALLCMGAPPQDPETAYAGRELLERAVALLPERDQTGVRLYLGEGLTFVQIAEQTGVHERTARERIHAAMRRLAVLFERLVKS